MSTARKLHPSSTDKQAPSPSLWHEQWSALSTADDGSTTDDAALGIEAALPFLWHGADVTEGPRA